MQELFSNPPDGWFKAGDVVPRISHDPRFEDDTQYLPLQAADMIVGATRATTLEGAVLPAFAGLCDLDYNFRKLGEADVARMGRALIGATERWRARTTLMEDD